MTNLTSVIPDADAEIRWREWQSRGATSDRQTAARMRKVMLLVVAGLVVWFVAQLA
jgi:hypothetical protein